MEQKVTPARSAPKFSKSSFQFEDSNPIDIERTFSAALDVVWKAWSTPEMLKQWWGPEGFTCPEAKMDFREGGKYVFAMQGPDQKIMWSGGVYQQIIPQKKIVCSDRFTDEKGNPVSPETYGMTGEWPEFALVTVELEALSDNHCKLHLVHEGIPQDQHDDCVQGWNSSINKLQQLVEQNSM